MKTEIGDNDKILRSRIRLDPPNEKDNLASFLRDGFKRHSSKTLLVDAKRKTKWTGGEILDKVERIATGLIEQANLKPGEVVLTICDHTDHELLLALGVILAGGAIYGTSPDDGYGEESNYCRMVKPSVIVSNSNLHQMVVKLKLDIDGLEKTRIIWIDNPIADSLTKQVDGINLDDNNNTETNNNHDSNNNNNNIDTEYYCNLRKQDQVILFTDDLLESNRNTALIDDVINTKIDSRTQSVTFLLTSGSTGKPKVVPNTHEELVWALQAMLCSLRYPVGSNDDVELMNSNGQIDNCSENQQQQQCEEKKIIIPLEENSVMAGDLPLDHGAGLNTMFLSLVHGSKSVILPSYQEDSFWQGVHDHRITFSIASTTFTYKLLSRLKQLIKLGEHKRWDLSCFKFLACCGAKLAFQDLVKEINSILPNLYIGQAYGCTEMGFISVLSPQDCRIHLDSVGHMVPGMIGKVVCPDSGKLLGPHQRGQLYLSSMTKFKGYKCLPGDNPSELYSQCHDEEGLFYKTGDYVHYDEEQRLYIHGRMKDTLFLMQDWKILPIELEEVVDQHPLVEYSAVIGIPDPSLPGCHAPKAFVKLIDSKSRCFIEEVKSSFLKDKLLANDREFIAEDIYNFVAERTAEPKHLKGGVRILDVFPRNGLLAKIDRKVLRQMD